MISFQIITTILSRHLWHRLFFSLYTRLTPSFTSIASHLIASHPEGERPPPPRL
jgi:hypothetical protein